MDSAVTPQGIALHLWCRKRCVFLAPEVSLALKLSPNYTSLRSSTHPRQLSWAATKSLWLCLSFFRHSPFWNERYIFTEKKKMTVWFLWIATSFLFHFLFPSFRVFIKFSIWSLFWTGCSFGKAERMKGWLDEVEHPGPGTTHSLISTALLPEGVMGHI